MPWEYGQSSGRLTYNGRVIATGYSGTGAGRNNPDRENERNVGPITRGRYRIERAQRERGMPYVMNLTPSGHNAHGRTGFEIHGDNNRGDASGGCIILRRNIRQSVSELISTSRDDTLNVVR